MNIPNMEERRPHTLGAASNHTDSAPTADPNLSPILADAADLLEGVHVLIVAIQEADRVRYRRRFMYSLDAAEKDEPSRPAKAVTSSTPACLLESE